MRAKAYLNILFLVAFIILACKSSTKEQKNIEISDYRDLFTYPIEGGRKHVTKKERYVDGVIEYGYDTTSISEHALYELEKETHLLDQFYTGYSEWAKIKCRISVNESHYWDKAMIGLKEKDDRLRIKYLGQNIYLNPLKIGEIKDSTWVGEFQNDSCRIKLVLRLDIKEKILNCLTGNGNILGMINDKSLKEDIFVVMEKPDTKKESR
jgi:hypothetical protein